MNRASPDRAPSPPGADATLIVPGPLNRLAGIRDRWLGRRLPARFRNRTPGRHDDRAAHSSRSPDDPGADAKGLHPNPIEMGLGDSIRDYWLRRMGQTMADWYAGVPIAKLPEDLRVYEHLIWHCQATVVIEIGAYHGGSALWFRDRLRAAASYGRAEGANVISIDRDTSGARDALAAADPDWERSITLLDGDIRDPLLVDRVAAQIPAGARCMVVEDSAHRYETTMNALRGFSRFVPVGGFFVVEDGVVDIEEMRLVANWPRGVIPAITDWLRTEDGLCFAQRRDLELYGISTNVCGFLERRAPAP